MIWVIAVSIRCPRAIKQRRAERRRFASTHPLLEFFYRFLPNASRWLINNSSQTHAIAWIWRDSQICDQIFNFSSLVKTNPSNKSLRDPSLKALFFKKPWLSVYSIHDSEIWKRTFLFFSELVDFIQDVWSFCSLCGRLPNSDRCALGIICPEWQI